MNFIDEQKYKKEIGIYKIENLVNSKVYIGQTKENFQRRYWLHRWQLRNGTHDNSYLQRAWNKYGEENFKFEVIEILPKEEIDDREKFWIKKYKDLGICYSIQDGGQPEKIGELSPETRKRIGELNRQRLLGSKLSEETKKKMSRSRKGKHQNRKTNVLTLEQAKEIKQRLVNGEKSTQIAKELNVPYKVINNILSNDAFKTTVCVEGWEEFQQSRKRLKRLSEQEIEEIYELYDKIGTYQGVARITGRDKEVIKYHILKRNKQ